jgi:hypothetical protein
MENAFFGDMSWNGAYAPHARPETALKSTTDQQENIRHLNPTH